MATPTISEYTAHLRQDKASMRDHLLSANITTKESDTFTDLSKKILEKSNAIRRIYVQPDEPAAKYGLWFKRDAVEDFDVVSDPVPFVGDTLSDFNVSYNPDSAYDKVKETKVIRANNTIYYLAIDNHKGSYPDEAFRIYKYDPYTNTYTKIQTYTADEVYNVRGDSGYYALSVFRKNGVACIDSEGEYLYLICGGYDALCESQEYITRFGLKSHSAERVHTRQSKWFPIPAGDSSNAQIVDNKIYIFGQSTNAAAYGNGWNTRIIDLTTGSESTLNNGPVAYQGRTVKVNSHLIAGFGGGNSSMNGGQGMTDVRLFDTLTNTTTKIATLTNRNNSRVLTVVGNLIYFVEYRNSGSSSESVGYVNLVDNSVTYIDDVFTPKLQNIATSSSLYLPSARAIVLGNYVGQTYSYNLDTKPYDKDTVVLFQSTGVVAQYVVDLFTTNNFKTDVPFNISDAWFYKAGEGLETTGEVYYGNGTEWLPLEHGNTAGGINALQLQHKAVTLTGNSTEHVTPDPGFEGLKYVDINYTANLNIYSQLEEPESKEGIWLQTDQDLVKNLIISRTNVVSDTILGSWTNLIAPPAFRNDAIVAAVGRTVYVIGGQASSGAWAYDVDTNTTRTLSNFPATITPNKGCVLGTDIYIMGGMVNGAYSNRCWKYDTLTDTYTELSPLIRKRAYAQNFTYKGKIYTVGGRSAGGTYDYYLSDADVYDPETDTHTEVSGFFKTTSRNGMVVIDNYLYKLSGASQSNVNYFATCKRIDLETMEAIDLAEIPNYSSGHVHAVAHGKYIYYTKTHTDTEFHRYNIETDTHETLTATPFLGSGANRQFVDLGDCFINYSGNTNYTASRAIARLNYTDVEDYSGLDEGVVSYSHKYYNKYFTNIIRFDNVQGDILFGFEDLIYYNPISGVDHSIPIYYGDGTEWIKFKN